MGKSFIIRNECVELICNQTKLKNSSFRIVQNGMRNLYFKYCNGLFERFSVIFASKRF